MGNIGSNTGHRRGRQGSRRSDPTLPPPQPQHPEMSGNRYVFAAATPYPANPSQNQPQHYQYPGYYPPAAMPMPLPAQDHRRPGGGVAHSHMDPAALVGRYPYAVMQQQQQPSLPYVEHQKAVTIRNDVNIKKETLHLEPDEENSLQFLVAFTFDATVAGSITVIFFAKEEDDCKLISTDEYVFPPVTVHFQQGLRQKFRQPSGTGIDFAAMKLSELVEKANSEVFPLAVKAEASPIIESGSDPNPVDGSQNSQITHATFEKEKGEYKLRVVKQILWVNGMRYELQEIYGIGNSVEGDTEGNDPGKECVICLTEPRDTTVLPCRHMCMCSGCAKVLRFQSNHCPICRQPVERLLEIKVNNGPED